MEGQEVVLALLPGQIRREGRVTGFKTTDYHPLGRSLVSLAFNSPISAPMCKADVTPPPHWLAGGAAAALEQRRDYSSPSWLRNGKSYLDMEWGEEGKDEPFLRGGGGEGMKGHSCAPRDIKKKNGCSDSP